MICMIRSEFVVVQNQKDRVHFILLATTHRLQGMPSTFLKFASTLGALALVLLNASLLLGQVYPQLMVRHNNADLPYYSHVGQDYPLQYPIGPLDTVTMTLHESVHFALNASDPVAADEWVLYSSIPKGIGRTRLGPNQRVFVLTVSHQMHCLRRIHIALLNREDALANYGHVHHCLNYLRQTLLCEAADTLERGDFMERDYELERISDTLVCRDWEKAFEILDGKYEEWLSWRDVWN
ncbi:hypothetical protein C8R44DRAFT_796149 [Mycena epipterygia]|nr:hypothetical protein C8R44DRAFT_796149 [Mycena epipterygia]